jgi:hypothetical protein
LPQISHSPDHALAHPFRPRKDHVTGLKENRRLVVAAVEETLGKGAVAGAAKSSQLSDLGVLTLIIFSHKTVSFLP